MFGLICNSIGSCSTHIATCLRPKFRYQYSMPNIQFVFFFWMMQEKICNQTQSKKYTCNCGIQTMTMASHIFNLLHIDWHWISYKHLIRFKEKCKQKQKCQNNIISGRTQCENAIFLGNFHFVCLHYVYSVWEDGSNSNAYTINMAAIVQRATKKEIESYGKDESNRRKIKWNSWDWIEVVLFVTISSIDTNSRLFSSFLTQF